MDCDDALVAAVEGRLCAACRLERAAMILDAFELLEAAGEGLSPGMLVLRDACEAIFAAEFVVS